MWGALLAGIGLALAGTAAQVSASAQARAAAERKTRKELLRQQEFKEGARRAFNVSLEQSTPEVAQRQIGQGTEQRQQEYERVKNLPFSSAGEVVPGSPSSVVETTKRAGQEQGLSLAQARLGGYTNWDLQQAIKNLRANQAIGLESSLARGSANVLPFELQDAAHAGDTLAGIGSLLSTVGAGLGTYGVLSAPAASAYTAAAPAAGAALWGSGLEVSPYYAGLDSKIYKR